MGINYNFRAPKNLYKYSNEKIKTGFYNSLILFSGQKATWNCNTSTYLLGERENFHVMNPEIQLEMLKRITKFSYQIAKKRGKILYVNNSTNSKFDGIVKFLSYRAGQTFVVGRWPCGLITKSKSLDINSLLLFSLNKNEFAIKEANKLGIPIISFNSLNLNISKTMYPIICNNLEGNSLFLTTNVLSNSILEGKLLEFTKNHLKKH